MKKKFSLALVALMLLSLVVPALVLAQQKHDQSNSSAGTNTGKTTAPGTGPGRRPRRAPGIPTTAVAQDFSEALSVIQEHYVDGKKIDFNAVYKSSIMGMLRVLDPHSNYFDKEEFDEMKTDQRSEYLGIGASIQNYLIGESVDTYVAATFQNAPASRAGLRYGDRIDAVDGVSMHAKSSAEVRDKIRGPRGSHVKLTITRANTGTSDTVEIVRDAVSQPSVPDAYMIRPGVGYIDMKHGFNYDTAEGLQSALDFLHARGMNSLVLDLRDNPGGFLEQAIHVAEAFLPTGQLILSQKGRNGMNDHEYRSRNPDPDRTPLVILVNDFTASASEIVAGAMQDHDRALIVGQTSFGKGLVQSIIPVQGRLRDPIFFFSRDTATGRVAGLDRYKVDRAIEFGHDLEATDYPMNDAVFNAFKAYVAKDANWKTFVPVLDRNRSFIEQQIRFQLATAAYGTVTAIQVLTKEDPQIVKAIEVVPRARDLAMAATRARLPQP